MKTNRYEMIVFCECGETLRVCGDVYLMVLRDAQLCFSSCGWKARPNERPWARYYICPKCAEKEKDDEETTTGGFDVDYILHGK